MTELQTNPLLQRIQMPGETFTLPSGGLFYGDGVVSENVKNAEIRVFPMTAIDEIAMRTPDLLFSGDAVRQVFGRCVPDIVDPDKLLSKDVDFLLTCLRKISFGDTMVIPYTHTCKDAQSHDYKTNVSQFIQKAKRINPTTIGKIFSVTLDNDQVVKIRPVMFGQFIQIMQSLQERKDSETPEAQKEELIASLASLITQVDEVTDTEMISQWLEKIPPKHIRKINDQIDKSSGWGTDFTIKTKCKDCGEAIEFPAPMNPLSFFI